MCVDMRHPKCHHATQALPRVYVLPGMDGTANLLLDTFQSSLIGGASRVVMVDYPKQSFLSFSELADFVAGQIRPDDTHGYVLVAQSFSGHVALRLATSPAALPGSYLGTVLVNSFCSAPLPPWARPVMRRVPPAAFMQQPPAWLASRILFGAAGTVKQMAAVQRVVQRVAPHVIAARLAACADESSWALWRDEIALPGESLLYLQGGSDILCGGTRHANLMQQARSDIQFHRFPGGGHLLLQTSGAECARAVDRFCGSRQAVVD